MRSLMYLESVLAIGAVDELLPVCTMPLGELLDHFEPDAVVDARMRKRATIDDQRSLAPTVVGLGPGLDINRNCHIGIETAWGDRLGQGVRSGMTAPLRGEPRPLAGIGRERFIYARRPLAHAARHRRQGSQRSIDRTHRRPGGCSSDPWRSPRPEP